MEISNNTGTEGNVSSQIGSTDSNSDGATNTSVDKRPTNSKFSKSIGWDTVAARLFTLSDDSISKGVLLSQVVGNFKDAPEYFKNSFGIGCSIVLDKKATDITAIYQDGSQTKLTVE
jgi:hypothetical protein